VGLMFRVDGGKTDITVGFRVFGAVEKTTARLLDQAYIPG
jgi:hypothetical protein